MSGHTVFANRSPLTRTQLMMLPLCGVGGGLMGSGCFFKALSHEAFLVLLLALSVTLTGLATWIVYRSDYATRHGMVASVFTLLFVLPFVAGFAVVATAVVGVPEMAGLATAGVSIPMLFTAAWALRRQLLCLVREGPDGSWVRQHVDADAGRIRADTLLHGAGDAPSRKPWLAIAFGVNLPLIYQSWGITDRQVLPWLLVALVAGGLWLCAAVIGPMAGKALYLRRLERAAGRRFFHEGYDDLQALRRGFWLSRLLMVDADGGPASTGESDAAQGESRAQRVRRYAQNALYTLAFLCLLAGVMGIFLLGWPSVQRALYFDGFRPADVIVTEVAITGRGSKWVGRGRVDGAEVDFAPGDLDPVIGFWANRRDDPALITVRARLPIRAKVLWNPQVQRRLLPLDASHEGMKEVAWFYGGGTSALTAIGALLLLLAGRFAPRDNTGSRHRRQRPAKRG